MNDLLFPNIQIKQTSLWTKFRLLFVPAFKSVDVCRDITATIWYKRLDGITYVVDTWYSTNGTDEVAKYNHGEGGV